MAINIVGGGKKFSTGTGSNRQMFGETNPRPVEGSGGIQFGIGGQGRQLGFGTPVSMQSPFGGGGLAQALQDAFNQTTTDFDKAIGGNLAPSDPRFGGFGAMLQNLATNPQGFGGDVMKRIMTRLAEREAGSRENALRALADSGGRNFASFGDVGANIRGQSAQRLNEAELQAEIQDALLRQTARGQGISGSVALSQILAGLNSQAAQFAAGRQRPLIDAGAGKTGAGNQFDLLNDNGEMINFYPDGTPLSAFDRERQRQQRIAWMESQRG